MLYETYNKLTGKLLVGKKVITLEEMHAGRLKIEKGTILTIKRKWRGFTLCKKLVSDNYSKSINFIISKVPCEKVNLL